MATEDKAAPYPWEGCDTGTWMWHIHHCRLLEVLSEPASVKVCHPHLDALRTHRAEIEDLHAEECPGCPWDGETLFLDKENACS